MTDDSMTGRRTEIEITPEMIEAGAMCIDYDAMDDLRDGIVTRWDLAEAVFREMLRVYSSRK